MYSVEPAHLRCQRYLLQPGGTLCVDRRKRSCQKDISLVFLWDVSLFLKIGALGFFPKVMGRDGGVAKWNPLQKILGTPLQSIWNFNILLPGDPRAFKLLKSLLVKFPAPGTRSLVKCPGMWNIRVQMFPLPGLKKNRFRLIFSFNLTAVIFSLIRQFLNVY